jgi:hypothetical protein
MFAASVRLYIGDFFIRLFAQKYAGSNTDIGQVLTLEHPSAQFCDSSRTRAVDTGEQSV